MIQEHKIQTPFKGKWMSIWSCCLSVMQFLDPQDWHLWSVCDIWVTLTLFSRWSRVPKFAWKFSEKILGRISRRCLGEFFLPQVVSTDFLFVTICKSFWKIYGSVLFCLGEASSTFERPLVAKEGTKALALCTGTSIKHNMKKLTWVDDV